MHCQPDDVVAFNFAFSGVQTRPHSKPQIRHACADVAGATDCTRGTIECRKKAVARGIHLAAAKGNQFFSNQHVPVGQQLTPSRIA